MIRFVLGNIFDSKAQTLVNTVNCVGIMGKGLAKEFKDRFPEMFKEYEAACRRGELRSGRPLLYRDLHTSILCVPTKDNWKGPSKYEFVEAGLRAIRDRYADWGIKSLAVPPLGCGLGGLEWSKVRALIEKHLGDLPIDVEVYEPAAPDAKIDSRHPKRVITRVKITVPLAFVGETVLRARKAMRADVPLGRILLQKYAFFAQVAGAPIQLRFNKYKFGPYDHHLNHMVERLEGLFIRDESTSWKRSDIRWLDEAAWAQAIEPVRDEIDRNSKYIDAAVALLSNRSLEEVELLGTVQYAWSSLVASGWAGTEEEVERFVHQWSREKQEKFPRPRIHAALTLLAEGGWLGPVAPGHPSPLVDPTPEVGEILLK